MARRMSMATMSSASEIDNARRRGMKSLFVKRLEKRSNVQLMMSSVVMEGNPRAF